MRKSVIAMAVLSGFGCIGLPAMAAPVAAGTLPVLTQAPAQLVQFSRSGHCARLRRACEYKEERGQVGEGNCRRYRNECGGFASYCERLRRACYNKDARGEVGQGNCRRYR